MDINIRVQHDDFSVQQETDWLRANAADAGAIVTFSGLVRGQENGRDIRALLLEHYPGMTEKSLRAIVDEAAVRWPLLGVVIIHRIGELLPGEQIVFVGVSSAHRAAAFAACDFLMDYLKTRAPFWKKCLLTDGGHWIAAKESDDEASKRW
jgi:molybdopterin synthase catalytic subunit